MRHDKLAAREGGRVMLVGAGPGPADLMTVRAQRAVENAEALLYDALVDPQVLMLAPRACLKFRPASAPTSPA